VNLNGGRVTSSWSENLLLVNEVSPLLKNHSRKIHRSTAQGLFNAKVKEQILASLPNYRSEISNQGDSMN
jgi:hypothetical protein